MLADDNGIHVRTQETSDCLKRCSYDRFILIQRRIEQDRHTGFFIEPRDQRVVEWIGPSRHRLQTSAAIHMGDGGNFMLFFWSDREDFFHIRRRFINCKPCTHMLF